MLTLLLALVILRLGDLILVGAATGAVVGLVVVTPCAGFVKPILCIPIGIMGAIASFVALQIKRKIYVTDDTLDAFR
jgi:Amt family ammonium transporter